MSCFVALGVHYIACCTNNVTFSFLYVLLIVFLHVVLHIEPFKFLWSSSFNLWYFDANNIRKIELTDHLFSYPQTKLKIRTNPAASRGEKIFTQNCLACHSVSTYHSPNLNPASLTAQKLNLFGSIHKRGPELKLDARSERGLIEYSEALAAEKPEEKTKK